MKSIQWYTFVFAAFIVAAFSPISTCNAQQVAATENTPVVVTEFKLHGVWAGVAYLEEAKLKAVYDLLKTEQEKEAFIVKAEAFLSAVAAFHIRVDGTYESDVELFTTEGKLERASTRGKYRIIEHEGPKYIVEFLEESTEPLPPERKLLQFYDDGEHFALTVPAPEEFKAANPLMIFERVPEDQLANPAAVAEQQTGKVVK
ncbi:MAG: hypothetical protein R3C03_22465 [Pirellulaceae bacterium]